MITLEPVTKSYDGGVRYSVQNLDLHVPEGKLLVLLGGSGCGKTTTLKMINRLIEPTSGRIEVGGRDISQINPVSLRRGIGYVLQSISLFPHLTVAENIALVPRLSERQVLRKVQLPLAAPVIIGGIRTATALVVGTATLATPVGGRSLGNYIFGGLESMNHLATVFGCVAAAALALLLDQLIHIQPILRPAGMERGEKALRHPGGVCRDMRDEFRLGIRGAEDWADGRDCRLHERWPNPRL